jgi:Bacterial extracellular solute-binding proteins, family 3
MTLIICSCSPNRSFDTNEHWEKMMDQLQNAETDIAFGTLAPNVHRHQNYDFSIQYFEDQIAWIVPVSEVTPKWQSLMLIFEPLAWFMSLLAYVCVAISMFALSKYFNKLETEVYTHLSGTFLVTWAILLGISLPRTARAIKLRAFVFLWAIFAIHWSTAYTTSLASTYATSYRNEEVCGRLASSYHTFFEVYTSFSSKRSKTY